MDKNPEDGMQVLHIILELCNELESRNIDYCHWKSNAALDRTARGDNDLDLLINRGDAQRFVEILYRLGFKEVLVPNEKRLPGVISYYGYDELSGRLIHVHAHFQLILGHDMSKNFRIPIELPYLASAVQGDLFRTPAYEFELIVFTMRMVLKHSTWDAILGRQGALSPSEKNELAYLEAGASLPKLYELLKQNVSWLDAKQFDSCLLSIHPSCPVWDRIKAGQLLQSKLKAYARRSSLSDISLKLTRRGYLAVHRRLFKRIERKQMASGGLLVAIIGGDGAGKSTAVNGLYEWLSKDFETIKVHMGKPPWSMTTLLVRGALKIGRSIGLYPYERVPGEQRQNPGSRSLTFPGYPWLLRTVCVARDRYLAYVKARRFATNGGLVISDRFPLPSTLLMDGPQIRKTLPDHLSNKYVRFFGAWEERYYQPISPPELLIVLRASTDISVQRKTDETADSVRTRVSEVLDADWQLPQIQVLDAERSREDVLSELRKLIWSAL